MVYKNSHHKIGMKVNQHLYINNDSLTAYETYQRKQYGKDKHANNHILWKKVKIQTQTTVMKMKVIL